jgi:5-(carboxyamino)imidazole ribonucleotide mutase
MGSRNDWETMSAACEMLSHFEIPHEKSVVSAHRTPQRMFQYAESARGRGLRIIIAGAGGAAHLPGEFGVIELLKDTGWTLERQE